MAKFDGRSGLVTGAGSGIGAATARRLLEDGARITGMDLLTLDLHATLSARLDLAAPAAEADEEGAEDGAEASGPLTIAIDLDDGAAGDEAATSPA